MYQTVDALSYHPFFSLLRELSLSSAGLVKGPHWVIFNILQAHSLFISLNGVLEAKLLSSLVRLIVLLIHTIHEGMWVVEPPPPSAGKQQLPRVLAVYQGYQPHHH